MFHCGKGCEESTRVLVMVEEEAEAKYVTCLYLAHTYLLLPALHDRADGLLVSFSPLALYSSDPLVPYRTSPTLFS